MSGSTELHCFICFPPGFPRVLIMVTSRFMVLFSSFLRDTLVLTEMRVRFAALLG